MVPLTHIGADKFYCVEEVRLPALADQMQLASMGIVRSAQICKVRKTPFGDPVEYLLDREQLVALENVVAAQIWVSEK